MRWGGHDPSPSSAQPTPGQNSNTSFLLQTLDPFSTDPDAFRSQLTVDPRAAVDLPMFIVDDLDLHGQGTVRRPAGWFAAIAPTEIALLGNLEDPAHDVECHMGRLASMN